MRLHACKAFYIVFIIHITNAIYQIE